MMQHIHAHLFLSLHTPTAIGDTPLQPMKHVPQVNFTHTHIHTEAHNQMKPERRICEIEQIDIYYDETFE